MSFTQVKCLNVQTLGQTWCPWQHKSVVTFIRDTFTGEPNPAHVCLCIQLGIQSSWCVFSLKFGCTFWYSCELLDHSAFHCVNLTKTQNQARSCEFIFCMCIYPREASSKCYRPISGADYAIMARPASLKYSST